MPLDSNYSAGDMAACPRSFPAGDNSYNEKSVNSAPQRGKHDKVYHLDQYYRVDLIVTDCLTVVKIVNNSSSLSLDYTK